MDFGSARQNMVDCQILPNNVSDPRIVDGLLRLPRENFVSADYKGVSYVDDALPLGDGRFLMEPMIVGRLLEELDLRSEDIALCIGCASGFVPALLASIVSAVVAVESNKSLAERASTTFESLSLDNIALIDGPLQDGHLKQAPYDIIIFDGAVEEVPEQIINQLAEDGRLTAVVNQGRSVGRAHLMTCHNGVVSGRDVFDANTPKLPGFEKRRLFRF
ncbi:MAG: hypothetical protein CBB68_03200 [Rhodospirillaceae bacterium TMED8]|nr:protein-L-isoaspartate O-methyltransferase [Magnetovibrio sp.]OUT51897.1 MAG: hypothetical protein CBB68_03200 [Rhodospirillaceae bacterium TMED8]|tara:strand:+ start:2009 stop:2662 length:654 start_codon:yes stop_codon:yes gene_type:complete